MNRGNGSDRAATPVVGNILLVAVAIVIAVVLITMSFAFLEQTGAPTAEAKFDYQPTAAGLKMTPQALGTDVTVELNGNPVAEIDADSAGQSVLVPTAPGDTITVVSNDADRSVLVNRRIEDRSEVGDLIAYYTFDSGNTTLVDRSGNGNDGTINGTNRTSGCLDFGGTGSSGSDYVDADDLTVENISEVEEFTVAVAYEPDTGDAKQDLIEHINDDGTNWVMEIKDQSTGSDQYELAYSVDKEGGSQDGEFFTGPYDTGERQVVVGTFDGKTYELYADGQKKGSDSFDSEQKVGVGDVTIAKDAEADRDYFDGEICEIRLYYTALDSDDIGSLTNAMG